MNRRKVVRGEGFRPALDIELRQEGIHSRRYRLMEVSDLSGQFRFIFKNIVFSIHADTGPSKPVVPKYFP